ncbi:hypothetical protein AB0D10_25470 [Kitasatospora sp. NPDC048545]|uniref:hypothetical protein n=1 Tax=Kitasatospora sp. NPDC048545 TaxID=3157208 RepID=UPI0033FE5D5D
MVPHREGAERPLLIVLTLQVIQDAAMAPHRWDAKQGLSNLGEDLALGPAMVPHGATLLLGKVALAVVDAAMVPHQDDAERPARLHGGTVADCELRWCRIGMVRGATPNKAP